MSLLQLGSNMKEGIIQFLQLFYIKQERQETSFNTVVYIFSELLHCFRVVNLPFSVLSQRGDPPSPSNLISSPIEPRTGLRESGIVD